MASSSSLPFTVCLSRCSHWRRKPWLVALCSIPPLLRVLERSLVLSFSFSRSRSLAFSFSRRCSVSQLSSASAPRRSQRGRGNDAPERSNSSRSPQLASRARCLLPQASTSRCRRAADMPSLVPQTDSSFHSKLPHLINY